MHACTRRPMRGSTPGTRTQCYLVLPRAGCCGFGLERTCTLLSIVVLSGCWPQWLISALKAPTAGSWLVRTMRVFRLKFLFQDVRPRTYLPWRRCLPNSRHAHLTLSTPTSAAWEGMDAVFACRRPVHHLGTEAAGLSGQLQCAAGWPTLLTCSQLQLLYACTCTCAAVTSHLQVREGHGTQEADSLWQWRTQHIPGPPHWHHMGL
jgi:hypothetical protein